MRRYGLELLEENYDLAYGQYDFANFFRSPPQLHSTSASVKVGAKTDESEIGHGAAPLQSNGDAGASSVDDSEGLLESKGKTVSNRKVTYRHEEVDNYTNQPNSTWRWTCLCFN